MRHELKGLCFTDEAHCGSDSLTAVVCHLKAVDTRLMETGVHRWRLTVQQCKKKTKKKPDGEKWGREVVCKSDTGLKKMPIGLQDVGVFSQEATSRT